MNPFDLDGPRFLVFYLVLGVVSYAFLRVYVTYRERQYPIPKLKMNDPFQIAFLRASKNEAIRIASLSLIDRGLLEVVDPSSSTPNLATRHPSDIGLGKSRLERALLRLFCARQEAKAAFRDATCKDACREYSDALGEYRLIRTNEIVLERIVPIGLIALLLAGVAVLKIYIAVERDRSNIWFLILLAIVLMVYFVKLIARHRTGLGDRVIADLKTLFQSLYRRRDSVRPRMQTAEAALLASVFGLSALPVGFQFARDIFRKSTKNGSSCGSACGSSCGGGGGGCGGCGS